MFVNTPGGGGLTVPPSPSSTHSDLDDLRSEVQQINNTNAHTPDPDPNKDPNKDPEKSDFDKLLDVLNSVLTSSNAANLLARENATNANNFEAQEAEKARQWSEKLSKEYYQNLVKDLEKAGLNKWMAVYGLSGGGVPSASQAHATNATTFQRKENILDTILQVVTLGLSLFKGLTSVSSGNNFFKDYAEDKSEAFTKLFTGQYNWMNQYMKATQDERRSLLPGYK